MSHPSATFAADMARLNRPAVKWTAAGLLVVGILGAGYLWILLKCHMGPYD